MPSNHASDHRHWSTQTRKFGAVAVVSTTPAEAAEKLCAEAVHDVSSGRHVHLVNAYTLALADKDPAYAKLLCDDGVNLPDGRPISLLSTMMRHTPRLRQVRGPQLFLDVFDRGRHYGVRHYLLGSTPEVLENLQKRLSEKFPGCTIVGLESPPFRPLSAAEYIEQDDRIREASPHIIWVGLGTPKQDAEVHRLSKAVGVTAIAVGAAFDFAAGQVPEAPRWMTRWSLEWLFRLGSEPRRLWKRYLFGNARFLLIALRGFFNADAAEHARN